MQDGQQLGGLHGADSLQVHGGVGLSVIGEGHGAQHLVLLDRSLCRVLFQMNGPLQLLRVQVAGQQDIHIFRGMNSHPVCGVGEGDINILDALCALGNRAVGEICKGPVEEPVGLVKTHGADFIARQFQPLRAHHNTDEVQAAFGGGGGQAISGL